MRVDGLNPYSTLPERSGRNVNNVAPADAARPAAAEQPNGVSANRALTTRSVSAAAPNAEYIPARRDIEQPVYGRTNQALASYESTARIAVEGEPGSVLGIDLFA